MPQSSASTIHLFDPDTLTTTAQTYIIYFITGNPGLIEYYRTFLSHLYASLSSSPSSTAQSKKKLCFQIYGRSLSGFEVSPSDIETSKNGPPYSLQAQIENAEQALEDLVEQETRRTGASPRVILMGHSVGAYILLEVLRRHRENLDSTGGEKFRISGGICLFPTVTHIAKSPSGRRLGPIFSLPGFALLASIFVKILFSWIPRSILRLIVQKVISFPDDAAQTTTSFLQSPYGVRQALHMARDELHTITTDTWDAEIWGVAHPTPSPHPRPILRFLFGQNDHWVADETRDDLIAARAGSEDWKPGMEVDEVEGWPHGFCISHSVPVAERMRGWVEEIVGGDLGV